MGGPYIYNGAPKFSIKIRTPGPYFGDPGPQNWGSPYFLDRGIRAVHRDSKEKEMGENSPFAHCTTD